MTIINVLAIVFVAIGIAFAVVDGGWRSYQFWFFVAFSVVYIIGPVAVQIRGP